MSKRRLPKPKWHNYVGIAVAVVVVGGGAALAAGAVGGGGDGSPDTVAAAHAGDGGGDGGDGGGADRPSPAASGSSKPSASSSVSPSASASATSSGKPTASATAKATNPGSGKTSGSGSSSGADKPSTVAGPAHPSSARVFTGLAFDACTAPSRSKMSAWKASSPYGAAAVYIGGRNRGCSQPNLTSSWVRGVSADGWKLVPIYVGAQPPCKSGNIERIGAANAASLGASDGADAVADAQSLGMRAGSALYLDMEGFDDSDTACVNSVLTYVQAWDKAVHARGYWAGFYGFSSSSAEVIDKAKPSTPDMPDALWYARYDKSATAPAFSGHWPSHRSGHQYEVNSKETYGGTSITVDRDAWDAPVAVIG